MQMCCITVGYWHDLFLPSIKWSQSERLVLDKALIHMKFLCRVPHGEFTNFVWVRKYEFSFKILRYLFHKIERTKKMIKTQSDEWLMEQLGNLHRPVLTRSSATFKQRIPVQKLRIATSLDRYRPSNLELSYGESFFCPKLFFSTTLIDGSFDPLIWKM